ncbi:NAD(P)H-binding protein [Ralstonia solanacearum]|uniref:NAD(P)-dependent oxidoreductase n=1 Tax=Ralstonia solanacearum TaxID=305 RepID=UPI0007C8AE8F|nr:NAD(P)H-binding protein [Ralstonia solanacearum]OAI58485.1 flavin reductase [Ralstonia solanacearum]
MKVTLFGATGKTGAYLIREGLKRGFEITVFARTGSSFQNPDVRIVRGDPTDIGLLQEAICGSDAVLSALGPAKMPHPKDLPITRATEAIISVMKQERITRLIAVSTGTAVDPGDGIDLKIWLPAALIKHAMPNVYRDIVGLAETIRSSDLDWTLVRAGLLKNYPASEHLNVGLYGHSKHSLTLSRENLARFMFDQISSREYVAQAPGISSRW